MGRRTVAITVAALLTLGALSLAACGSEARESQTESIAERYALHLTGSASPLPMTLPTDAAEGGWDLKQEAVAEAGYDLRPWLGREVTLLKYPISERHGNESLYLWLVMGDDKVVGAYATVREDSMLAPGVFALTDLLSD